MFDMFMSNVFIQSVHIYIVYKMIDVYLYYYNNYLLFYYNMQK